MKTIWKFILLPDESDPHRVTVEGMPKFAKPIHVESQGEALCLWAEVDTTQPVEKREFYVFGTGHEMTPEPHSHFNHLGTGQFQGTRGALVLHVYEQQPNDCSDEE
jgi:hypothetical protein